MPEIFQILCPHSSSESVLPRTDWHKLMGITEIVEAYSLWGPGIQGGGSHMDERKQG